MSKDRITALFDGFQSLLMDHSRGEKQCTFAEMGGLRFFYQTVNNVYVVLLTKKHSNILQDIDSLRIYSRVVFLPAPSGLEPASRSWDRISPTLGCGRPSRPSAAPTPTFLGQSRIVGPATDLSPVQPSWGSPAEC
ncbi:coatomer subunit delta [Ditylenchus destructor]|uniref:Coatomer subunit delta n=1 Tax=Ditylenchus destructor TaxID=166010 RepID=A0AAD4MZ05_9BILA|nr:coatomer subunit delta [Ditylenchus destructor]